MCERTENARAETGQMTLQRNTCISGLKRRGYKYVRANLMAKGRANSQLAPLINCPRPRASRSKMSLVNPFSKPVNLFFPLPSLFRNFYFLQNATLSSLSTASDKLIGERLATVGLLINSVR